MPSRREGADHEQGSRRRRPVFSGQDVRQGEIILRTRARRIIFIAGLVGIVVLALVLSIVVR
ncbi:peptide ABC transporter permease [Mesorhizobium loti]|uniref:Peptide ABC transporter permease n=1 Tax=Rhizobium loti TaxID=381 RepID=A0A117N3X4_RHILI|nr:peptide ABC transporter permease [Mesorhizobium loti]